MPRNSADPKHIINVAYGKGAIPLQADPKLAEWHVFRPKFEQALANPEDLFRSVCRQPVGCPPLRELIGPTDRVVIVTSDGTRPVPNGQLLPWLLQELPVSAERVTILLGNGSHRANTAEEITSMFGAEVARQVTILNHNAFEPRESVEAARLADGTSVLLNRRYVEADKRIVVGFIEPHFFAGFSGGAKGIVPGIAAIETILHVHRAELIAHPQSTWGTLADNPIRQEIAEMVAFRPPEFMINVTLNADKQITGFFVGDYLKAHQLGCARVKEASMVPVRHLFPVVVTSNSGYPLDQNLYQAVKGMSAAARIVEPGGTIFVASECCDGIPAHGNFAELMGIGSSADDILGHIFDLEQTILDQWQAQVLADLMNKANIVVYSGMDEGRIRACKLQAVDDLQLALEKHIRSLGRRPKVAVLPDGPLTIPYLEPGA